MSVQLVLNLWNKFRSLIQAKPFLSSFVLFSSFFGLKLVLWNSVSNEIPLVSTAIAIIALVTGVRLGLFYVIPGFLAEFYFFTPENISTAHLHPGVLFNLFVYTLVLIFIAISFGSQFHLEEETRRVLEKQKEWIGIASHELKTPVHGIIGLTRILKEKIQEPQSVRFLNLIEDSSWQLNKTVTDLLDLSKLASAVSRVELIRFSLKDSIQLLNELFQISAQEKNIRFRIESNTEVDFIKSDLHLFQQILMNLLDNAIKYTPPFGEVILRYGIKNLDGSIFLFISVQDSGPGIEQSEFKQIFTPFYRIPSTRKKASGTGLGLAICKGAIEKLGGTIGVHSQLSAGSEFWFQIPIQTMEDSFRQSGHDLKQNKYDRKTRVLVADDNEINQLVLMRDLRGCNLDIDVVSDGREVLQKCQQKIYQAILMDCQMPGIDGFRTTEFLREYFRNEGKKVPVIIGITADTTEVCHLKAKQSGMDFLLYKPIRPDELRSLLFEVLPKESLDIRGYFFAQKKRRLDEIFQLFEQRKWTELKQRVHYLRSSCLAIDAHVSSEICEKIELNCSAVNMSFISGQLQLLDKALNELEFAHSQTNDEILRENENRTNLL